MGVIRCYSARFFVVVLLLVYGGLFIVLHRMEIDSTFYGSNVKVAYVQNPFENVRKEEARVTWTNATLFPAPLNWKNYLFEGRDDKDGRNLWEYTDLPTWMKGRKK